MKDVLDKSEIPKNNAHMNNLWKAFCYGTQGLWWGVRYERAIRQEVTVLMAVSVLLFLIPLPLFHKLILLGSVFFVLIVECLNTGIEKAIDRISKDHHPLSKIAKDIASAAVLLSIIFSLILWICLCAPLFVDL